MIKVLGKERNEVRILTVNDSINVTLDPDRLCTVTTVSVSPASIGIECSYDLFPNRV